MAFKFFQSMGFTGQPSVDQFRTAYGIFSVYIATGAFVDEFSLSIDTDTINSIVDEAIDLGYEALCWKELGSNLDMSRAGITDPEIDAILDAIKSIYDVSKERAIFKERPDFFIGFYDVPGGFQNNYNAPVQYEQNPSNQTYVSNFQVWTRWMDRLNQRFINGSYVSVPFSDSCDFIAPSIIPFFGNSVAKISEWKIFARRTTQEMKNRISGGKPVYPFFTMVFDKSTQWAGTLVSQNHMNEAISLAKLYSNGIVLFGGIGSSFQYGNYRYRPSGINEAADLAAWKTITNGSFSVSVVSNKFKITGINTSAAANMAAVASTLQTAIQNKITSGVTYDNSYPITLGSVSVTWNSSQKSFLFTMTTNGTSTPQPPNFHRGIGGFYISGKNDWGANIAGTDLGVSQFCGDLTINNTGSPGNAPWIYLGTQSNREWQDYAESSSWWSYFAEQSLTNEDIKDFKYFYYSSFTGQPNTKNLRDKWGLEFMATDNYKPFLPSGVSPGVVVPILSSGPLTVNDASLNSIINDFLHPSLGDSQRKYFSFDVEDYGPYIDKNLYNDTIIDNMLDSFVNLYTRMKQLLAAAGASDVKIGLYLVPSFKSYFNPVLYHNSKGNNASDKANYNSWIDKYRRINLRKSGSGYITKKFSESMDFSTCEVYPFYGETDIYDDAYFKENMIQGAKYIAGDKPFYVFIGASFHPSTAWTGKPITGDYMIKVVSWVKRIADGAILWLGAAPSYRSLRKRHFMTSSGGPPAVPVKTLSDWQAITNGCFSYFIPGFNRAISGVNFSSATSIGGAESTSVANIIESAINSDLYYIDNFIPTSNNTPGFSATRPYPVGTVIVNYNSDTSNNDPFGTARVPCFEFSRLDPALVCPPDFNAFPGREHVYCFSYTSLASLPVGGIDIGSSSWIGSYQYTYQEYDSNAYSGADRDADEFNNGWVVGNNWFHSYSSMAIAHKYSKERSIKSTEILQDWTGKPNTWDVKNRYNVERSYVAYASSTSDWSQFTDLFISSKITECISNNANIFIWNIDGSYVTLDTRYHTNTQIDSTLDNIKSLYQRTKSIMASSPFNNTSIKVGFYGSPFGIETYYGAMYWADTSAYSSYLTNGSVYNNNLIRMNQRFINGSLVSVPFLEYNDFLAPSYYPISQGFEAAEQDEVSVVKGSMRKILDIFGHDKPIYPFLMPYYAENDNSNPNRGLSQKASFVERLYTQCLNSECDGFVLWAGANPSGYASNHKFTPNGTKSLANWQSVTNGCFIMSIDFFVCKVKNVNFSTASNFSDIATIIQNAINNQIAAITVDSTNYPNFTRTSRNIGNVTVTWDSLNSKFIFNSDRGSTKSPKGQIFPPDIDKGYFELRSWSSWGNSESLPGTDIGNANYIGSHNIWSDFTLTITNPSNEFSAWADGSQWWNCYKSFAFGSFGTNLYNRVIPVINIITPLSGEAPFTVHVDAANSLFNGIDAQDCIFEWDFGDSGNNISYIKRNMISDHRVDTDCDSLGSVYRNTSLSSKQRGINAAYTYYHNNGGNPFTITLKIWHNGHASSTVSQKITITNPVINDYPTNVIGQWTKVQIMPDNRTPGDGFPNAFQNLNAAVSWMNSNKSEGKVIFELISGTILSKVNFPLTGKLTIDKPNILIKGYNQNLSYIEAGNSFSRSSVTPLVEIGANAYNVHFQDVGFGKSSELPNTSNLIGCNALPPPGGSTFAKNITFSSCVFVSLDQAIVTKDFVNGVYLNQCVIYQTNSKSLDLLGYNYVINACSNGENSSKIAVYNGVDAIINFGLSGGVSEKLSINFCDLRYFAHLGNNCTSGSLYFKNAKYIFVYGSVLNYGANYIDDCISVRIDSNIMNASSANYISPSYNYGDTGIMTYLLTIKAHCVDVTFVNNRCNIDLTNNTGSNGVHTGILCFGGSYGVINNIVIANNTTVVKGNLWWKKAYWDLSTPTGCSISNIEFVNNLNVENAAHCLSRWISVDANPVQFRNFSHNIWPMRLDSMEFAFVGGSVKDYGYWSSFWLDSNSQKLDVVVDDLLLVYRNKLLISKYPEIQTNAYFHYSASKDFNDEVRSLGSQYGVGAARPLIPTNAPAGSFSVFSSSSSRSRSSEVFSGPYTWNPSSSENVYISVTDSFVQTYNSNLQLVSKPVFKQIDQVNNIVSFTDTEVDSSARAFRVKIDLSKNPNYKDAFFGVVTESSIDKFVGILRLQNGTDQRLFDFTLSSYSTTDALASAILNYGVNTLGLSGFYVEAFGSTPTTEILSRGLVSDLTTASDKDFRGAGSWAISYFNPSSTIAKWGNYINTAYSISTKTDGYDFTITYSNDGPINDGSGNSRQYYGDPRQRIGSLFFDGFMAGKVFSVINNFADSSAIECNAFYGNHTGSNRYYPFDKFSPTENIIGQTYALGISVKYDHISTKKNIKTNVSSLNSTVATKIKWLSDSQSDSNNFANADCLQFGESFQVTISIRITRDIRNWVRTLSPYKTYFAQNYGGVKFMKDPRPILFITPTSSTQISPFYYIDYQGSGNQSPSWYGWAWWGNVIKNNYKTLGYERQIMSNLSGLYDTSNLNNNPFFSVSPLVDSYGEFPHSSITNHLLYQGTSYMIRDAIQEVPVFGVLQGHGTSLHKKWNPDERKDIYKASQFLTYNNGSVLDGFSNEWDLINYYLKSNLIGLDSYSSGLENNDDTVKLFDYLRSSYAGCKIVTRTSPDDIGCVNSVGFLSSINSNIPISGPNCIADFILPGNEMIVTADMSGVLDAFPSSSINYIHIRNKLAAFARWGYVAGGTEINETERIDTSLYQSVDRRFVYDSKPNSYGFLANPSNIKHSIVDQVTNSKYNVKKQTIKLYWDSNTESDFSHYLIYKAPVINGVVDTNRPYQLKAYLKYPQFTDNQVFPGKTYYYKIVAVDYDGNQSIESSYQVTHIADDPILNPPTNVSATSEVANSRIVVAWKDPLLSFLPSVENKNPPKIIIQGDFSGNAFSSSLFDLSFVFPMIVSSISLGDSDARSMEDRATVAADVITAARDRWAIYRPNIPFRYAFLLKDYGYGWGDSTTRPFYHINDRLSNGSSCLWTVNGRAEAKAKMITFFANLSTIIRSRGISEPVYVGSNYDKGATIAGGDYNSRLSWHNWLISDPRHSSVLFDGNKTYDQYISTIKDLDGNPIPINELYPLISAGDPISVKRIPILSSITSMVIDYGLWDTIGVSSKSFWPHAKYGNLNSFCANRQYLVNSSRFKESPIDLNSTFHADLQVPSNYGWSPIDANSYTVGYGYDTYQESILRYGINTQNIRDYNDLVRALDIGKFEYICKGCQIANPNKAISQWMKFIDVPYIYDNLYESQNIKYPNNFIASLLYDKNHVINIFRVFNKYNVEQVGFLLNQTNSVSQDLNLVIYNKIYNILSNLQEAGYVMP